jgi:chromosome segregation ATPase
MAVENGQPQEIDLDRTDKLPILEGVIFDPDVADDAVRIEYTASMPAVAPTPAKEFTRGSAIDLPSLAESVRSVEERIARQSAEFDALTRAYERLRDAESTAVARAASLEKDLAAARSSFEAEQIRSRDFEKNLNEKSASLQTARSRNEELVRESERGLTEARTLRDSLAARDATIVQVLHSLGERDAQISALQQEHAKMLPALEARAKTGTQMEEELTLTRNKLAVVSVDFKTGQENTASLTAQLKRSQYEISQVRAELASLKTQASSHLELLRSRDWRSGFNQNLFRDWDEKIGAADSRGDFLKVERDQLQAQVSALEATLSAHTATISSLQGAATSQASAVAQQAKELQQAELTRAEWTAKLSATEAERDRLTGELAARDAALAEAQAASDGGAQRIAQLLAEHGTAIAAHEAEAQTQDEEMTVLMAHLHEARKPIEAIEGDMHRLREELTLKGVVIEELTEEGNKLRAALERTRGQLEEREFLIRRLERSESNNANALGRIQTSMERLGSVAAPAANVAAAPEWTPELIRIDGDRSISHALGRRTRIGRAPGCELHIDSTSVSRHHALILAGTREAIIEDLNSTNGVILNGRKVTRQVLNDGDIVTIGEIQFRYVAKPVPPPLTG